MVKDINMKTKKVSFLDMLIAERIENGKIKGTLNIGNKEFNPPFKRIGRHVVDVDENILCSCETDRVAQGLVNLLYELV